MPTLASVACLVIREGCWNASLSPLHQGDVTDWEQVLPSHNTLTTVMQILAGLWAGLGLLGLVLSWVECNLVNRASLK